MSRRPALRAALVGIAVTALALTGCASGDTAPADGGEADDTEISEDAYVTPGKLTIATGETAYFPYVIDDDPASGEGFEAAVAYAVAEELGFAAEDVEWVRTSFEAAIAPGPKNFDINIQQYTITDERKQAVDFSSPYYSASQAVVAIEGGAADDVDDIAGLKDLVLGAMAGSTSATTIDEAVQPTTAPQLYNSNEDAVAALIADQIDAIVLDLPTAYYATGVYIEDSFIVGELPAAGVPDEWGLLLPKDSPLTEDVTAAVDALREDGTLEEITDEWLGSGQGVTLLQ
ncbi:transporter substrate-binding domain-containing protein [Microbacterium sp. ARD31]|jgi:polar amino acid transport system substrate-binding protein|uniref:ABC transporter substrate-binding protein n=1 Tax=unclassified Microbacterium TaxID=2609290 RepID=UPI0020402E00|nr:MULTISPECIES: transporter substrate-binding domain-containing protein [unclassified Microbacterium]MDT0183098.1 transporter substrate-binding domain-containing protein [Microbacterium sp. ARD31]